LTTVKTFRPNILPLKFSLLKRTIRSNFRILLRTFNGAGQRRSVKSPLKRENFDPAREKFVVYRQGDSSYDLKQSPGYLPGKGGNLVK
jgi:hypothetical protein